MKIGIFGAGMIGETLGELWALAGHEVFLSSRHPETLGEVAARVGAAGYGSVEEAAVFGEVLLVATPFKALAALAEQIGAHTSGKLIVDASNPFEQRDGEVARHVHEADAGSGAFTQRRFPEGRVVKAFNTVYFQKMRESRTGDARVGVPTAAEDTRALALAHRLIEDAGMQPYHVGALADSWRFDPDTPPWNSSATVAELRELLPASPHDANG